MGTARTPRSGMTSGLVAWHNENAFAEPFPAIQSLHQESAFSSAGLCFRTRRLKPPNIFWVQSIAKQCSATIEINVADLSASNRGSWILVAYTDSCSSPGLRHHIVLPNSFGKAIYAPLRVQFFVWLLVHGRIQCRTTLFRKTIVGLPICEICKQPDETCAHIDCRFAGVFGGMVVLDVILYSVHLSP